MAGFPGRVSKRPPQETYNHNGDGIVVKHSGHILDRKLVRCVRNQQTGLSDGTVSDYDALDRLRAHYSLLSGQRYVSDT